jgi:hypothetical protein
MGRTEVQTPETRRSSREKLSSLFYRRAALQPRARAAARFPKPRGKKNKQQEAVRQRGGREPGAARGGGRGRRAAGWWSCWWRHWRWRSRIAVPCDGGANGGPTARGGKEGGRPAVSPIVHQRRGRFPPKSRQKASPECLPPSWYQPRPQSPPGGAKKICSTKTNHTPPGAEQTFWVATKSKNLDRRNK